MVGTHQLVAVLSPPTQDQWTETLSMELARSQLFCLLSVVGDQAGNIGKELIELWHKQTVLSSEIVFEVLSEYAQSSLKTGTRISCAVIVFKGTRTIVAGLRAGVSLSRDSFCKTIINASDEVEIREGSSQSQDYYFIFTELAGRLTDDLLSHSKYPDLLLKQWRATRTAILESTVGAEGLGVGMVLPNQLLESSLGLGFLEFDQGLDGDGSDGIGLPGGSKSGEKNLLQQRRASRRMGTSWRQRLSISVGLITAKLLRKSNKTVVNDVNRVDELEMPDVPSEEVVVSKSIDEESKDLIEETGNISSSVSLTNHPQPEPTSSFAGDSHVSSKPVESEKKSQQAPKKIATISSSIKNFSNRLKSRKSVFVGHHVSRKRLLIIIGCILFIIAMMLGLGYLRHARQVAQQVAIEQLIPYQQKLEEIRVLGETDPVSARAQAQSQLAELGSLQTEGSLPGIAKEELERLLNETKSVYESLNVVSDLTALPLFDDLRRLSPSFLASSASGDGSQGILADRDQQLLIAYTATDKTGQVVDAAKLEKVIAVSQLGERSYVLGDGVWSLNSPAETELNQVIKSASQTEGATLIASFGTNVYVFNPTQRALYRYVASGSSFGSPTNWLTGAAPFTFTDVSSVIVDGEVWFGTNQGQIYRFVGGKQAEFSVTGLDQALSSTVYLATNPEGELMVVLEPARKRLVIINKRSGLVDREFINPNLGAATGVWLDEANNQVLISSGAALYNISITDSAP